MDPRNDKRENEPQDRKEDEQKRPGFKPQVELLEERVLPSSWLHDLGIHPSHSKPW